MHGVIKWCKKKFNVKINMKKKLTDQKQITKQVEDKDHLIPLPQQEKLNLLSSLQFLQ